LTLKSAILALKSAILALEKRHFSHRTRILEARTPHQSATAVAVRMHRSQQCAAPLAGKNADICCVPMPQPLLPSLLHFPAFAAVAAYLCHRLTERDTVSNTTQAVARRMTPRLVNGKSRVGLIPGAQAANPYLCPTPTSRPVPYAPALSYGPEHLVADFHGNR